MRNRLTFFTALVCAVVILQSCGSSQTTPSNPLNSGTCSITLSGAVTATVPCTAIGAYDSAKGSFTIGITMAGTSSTATAVTLALTEPGNIRAGSFTNTSATTYGAGVIAGSGATTFAWVVSAQPKQGSITINLNSYSSVVTAPAGLGSGPAAYLVHGSAAATLVGQSGTGAAGNVMLVATF